jgi:hypothetical protein
MARKVQGRATSARTQGVHRRGGVSSSRYLALRPRDRGSQGTGILRI